MSGFVAILNTDGTPVDPSVLNDLVGTLAFRGPDGRQVWVRGSIGLGHALLRRSTTAQNERQPFSLDNGTWIVADARVDARRDLLGALAREPGGAGAVSSDAPDVELILRAYWAWGVECVQHVLGDFSFVIWDATQQRLFAARDQFGVKPLFYARTHEVLLVSNTLDCLRQHPRVSSSLDDLAIADFLLFDSIQDPAASSFRDIRRVPAAHALTFQNAQIALRPYWTLSVKTPIRYKREAEYVEHFCDLLDVAVADRVRAESAGVLMSGGLDSPTVAASAKRVLLRAGNQNGLRAYTEVFERLIPDEERRYASLVADRLHIPVEFLASDDSKIFGRANFHSPQPVHSAWPDSTAQQLMQVSEHSHLALTGFGGDPLLSSLLSVHFRQLLRAGRFGQALGDVTRYLRAESRLSRLYIRKRLRRWFPPKSDTADYPGWLNPELERRLCLRERWENQSNRSDAGGMVRPIAYEQTISGFWTNLFESLDAGATGIPVEVCHPFFDLRLVRFLLALPTIPWCSDKELLREAGRGVLPDAVRLRRKSPLRADPLVALLQEADSAWVDGFEPTPELERYVRRERIPKVSGRTESWPSWIDLRPLSLNFWLVRGRQLDWDSGPLSVEQIA